jgi:ADP-heptose:LPS heptosyltransferase
MLQGLGFAVEPGFALRLDPACLASTGIDPAWRGRYIHFSPSASEPAKELALAQTIELAVELCRRLPQHPLVISTTAAPRHRQRLDALLAALPTPPLAVFAGTLDTAALFCLIQNAALHVSSDSGPVHMAVAANTPSVSWFQQNPYIREYLPQGPPHFAFVTAEPRAAGITGIAPADIVERCIAALGKPA